MKIQDNILAILAECRTEGNVAYLPGAQLDRKTYLVVNDCLESIGGKWNRKAKGHTFDGDAAELLEALVATGETTKAKSDRQIFQYFPTPPNLAAQVCEIAELNAHSRVLEPSAGEGALIKAMLPYTPQSVYAVEINGAMVPALNALNDALDTIVVAECGDFLGLGLAEKISVNRVVMNPPFTKQQDIIHVMEAWKVLRPGGILVAIMSPSPWFRDNRLSTGFREWASEANAEVFDVPEGAFKASGTNIRTKIIKARKAAQAGEGKQDD